MFLDDALLVTVIVITKPEKLHDSGKSSTNFFCL